MTSTTDRALSLLSRARRHVAAAGILVCVLAIGLIAGHLATRSHASAPPARTAPVVCADAEDDSLYDCTTRVFLDFRPTPRPGFYVVDPTDCYGPGDCGYGDNGKNGDY